MVVYSHSRLSVYQQCPLKYKLQYLDKIKVPEEVEGIEGFMGSRVHDALKKLYDDLKYTRVNNLPGLLSFYEGDWQKNWHEGIVITKQDLTPENYRALGRKLIESYYNRHVPFDRDDTIGTEMLFHFSLDTENNYRMRGFIDRLARAKDGAFEIHDYKTSGTLPSQEQLDNDRQLALYRIGVQQKWPQAMEVRLVWHYLAFDAEMVSTRSEEAIAGLRENTIKLIDEIESARDFQPRESFLCNWCDFPGFCPEKKHIALVENLPVNEYLKEPGVVLVNRYAELKEQATAIGEEMDRVREAIIAYAAAKQVTAVRGSDRLARLRSYRKLRFPGKNDDGRQELEDFIVNAGKWMQTSQLDTFMLARLVENKAWDRDLIDEVMKYGRIDQTTTVTLSRLKDQDDA
ncbi:MAG: PD-(D/E)XK nuclease family protein [Chloroflexi bacterium]|nr:PD-(D/E)XK nuclease family protein [Chloroflexota bacterium]